MKTVLLAATAALLLTGGAAFAASGDSTTTSMAAPKGSPGYAAPRSAAVPGLPPQERAAEQANAAGGRQVNQGITTPVQGPTNPRTGHTQTGSQ